MAIKFKQEIGYWALIVIPYIYLACVFSSLPETIPTHFNIDGDPDGWSSKVSLWFLPASLPLAFYLLLLYLPKIDPKQKLKMESGKFERVRLIVLLFMTILACFITYISTKQNIAHISRFLFSGIGLFFAALGNLFPALKPNYFIGLRTPWALENELVWKKTHQFAGKLWVIGGLVIVVLPFFFTSERWLVQVFLAVTLSIAFVPFLYSYIIWRKLKQQSL